MHVNEREYRTLVLASLLYPFPTERIKMPQGVDAQLYESLIHAANGKSPVGLSGLCLLLRQAITAASGNSVSPSSAGLLRSVMSTLTLTPGRGPVDGHLKPAKLTPESIFPSAQPPSPAEHTAREKEAIRRINAVLSSPELPLPVLVARILSVIEEEVSLSCGHFCPPETGISLYDEVRCVSAVSAALYLSYQDKGRFQQGTPPDEGSPDLLLVTGDFSGIQRYIFSVANLGVGGVARRLRARSFTLTAAGIGLVYQMVMRLGLPFSNIIIQSGGNFFVLLPNTDASHRHIRYLEDEVATEVFTSSWGELSLHLGSHPFSLSDMADYGGVVRAAMADLAVSKNSPVRGYLQSCGNWKPDRFVWPNQPAGDLGYCASCEKAPAETEAAGDRLPGEERFVCGSCADDLRLGRLLPRARLFSLYDNAVKPQESFALPGGLSYTVAESTRVTGSPLVAFALNEFPSADAGDVPVRPLFVGNYVPLDADGSTLEFSDLASRAQGRPLLAMLKADVDNLGAMFALGLGQSASMPQTIALSRNLDVFFGMWLQSCLKSQYPNTYLVFSGGDDMLALGPWNEMLCLAEAVSREFRRFSGLNPDVTLSAGVALFKQRQPVWQVAEQAEENLGEAKREAKPAGGTPRDQISALGEVIKWKDFAELLTHAEQLGSWLNSSVVPSAQAYRLLKYAEMYENAHHGRDLSGYRYIPLMRYEIARNLSRGEQAPVRNWMEELLGENSAIMPYLGFVARHSLLQRRKTDA